ncbi:transcriptional regulator, MarR family [Leptospira ryugenii]|uniref:Transcriptional regulator, MarR family n=1 Tax=Leptospira ryugenii TaxID=1917863 RepID=A0A2P2DZX4_9LEPT|nr:MarR family transcriptional regulator [Leptospira ryugenii]GBF50179.1 transcriptional regulator, MarR family [Leptospira ryugenii]
MKQRKSNQASADRTFRVKKAEDSTGFLLWQVISIWQREIRHRLEPLGLTHSQFVLLASLLWLNSQNEEVTQVLISEHTKIDPMTTSSVLRTLEKKGYIQRSEHSTDTRAKSILLSIDGEKIAKQAVREVETFDHEFFASLGSNKKDFNNRLKTLL